MLLGTIFSSSVSPDASGVAVNGKLLHAQLFSGPDRKLFEVSSAILELTKGIILCQHSQQRFEAPGAAGVPAAGTPGFQPPRKPPRDGMAKPFVSDFFDFSIYLHADVPLIEHWYEQRFMRLRETAFRDPRSYFKKYADLSDAEAVATAHAIWNRTILPNLLENILPTMPRASLVLTKGASHSIEDVALRKL